MSRWFRVAVVAALSMVVACGGGETGEEATTTIGANDVATTTQAPPTTEEPEEEDGGRTVELGDIPQECIDAFVDFLQAIEPFVEDIDWANATLADMEEIGAALEPAADELEAGTVGSECDDLEVEATDEESFEYMIELAREEAPGTVGYFEFIRDFASSTETDGGDGVEASGDCETDIAAMQDIIDQGGTMEDLSLGEITSVGNLITSISIYCSPQRSSEFFEKEDVAAWMGGG